MKKNLFKNLFILLVFGFLFLPIIVLIVYSFNESKMNILFEGFTLKWYKVLFTNKDLLEALKNTLIIAITSTIISTIVGTISAIGLYKYNFKFKKFINKLIYIPIVIPEIVLGISLLSIYTLMKLDLGMFTLIISHIAFSVPFVIISVRTTLTESIKINEEASIDLGANYLKTFFYVTLPQITPGVISGAIFAFTLSMDDVVISYFTSGPSSNTLPLKIYSMIKTGITPDVNALSSIMLIITMILLISSSIISAKKISKGAIS